MSRRMRWWRACRPNLCARWMRPPVGRRKIAKSTSDMLTEHTLPLTAVTARSLISIIIPALNEEAGITDIVQRVLAQQPAIAAAGIARLEVIVVDDGSEDETA